MATPDRMALLHRRLRRIVAGADVRLLARDQVLVSRNLMRNPAFEREGKSATYVPGPGGYQVYVACHSAETHEERAALSQRMTGPSDGPAVWDGRSMRLRVDTPATSGDWLLRNRFGEVVTVRATGSARVLDEVNAVLSEVEAVLLT